MLCGTCRWRVKCTARGVRMCRLVLCKARVPHLSADCTPIFGAHPCAVPTCAERAGPAKCQNCHHRHGVFSIEPTEDEDDDKDKDKDVSCRARQPIGSVGATVPRRIVLACFGLGLGGGGLSACLARLCSMRGSKAPPPPIDPPAPHEGGGARRLRMCLPCANGLGSRCMEAPAPHTGQKGQRASELAVTLQTEFIVRVRPFKC